ncbi:MAG: N-acetyl-gamma-glutamyl-phosphate reductase [Candidatus Margulisiibacteriota bacterium]
MKKIKIGIIGATGYSGEALLSILLRHPNAAVEIITSKTYAGQKISQVYPHLTGITDLVCTEPDMHKLSKMDVVFLALPHGLSVEPVKALVKAGVVAIDIGADFRFRDAADYKTWYGAKHLAPELCKSAVYGLPEIHAAQIKTAKVIANPGCYATASILALYPLLKKKLVKKDSIVIDAKSGVSGAGRGLTLGTHYTECNEAIAAYKVAEHRHTGEIEQEIESKVTFVPHLTPMDRGILAVCYADAAAALKKPGFLSSLELAYKEVYRGAKFIRLFKDTLPSTKYVRGTNFCDIAVKYDRRTGKVIVISAIDNLIKGAAGQAVQNMNLRFNLPESTGLDLVNVYP